MKQSPNIWRVFFAAAAVQGAAALAILGSIPREEAAFSGPRTAAMIFLAIGMLLGAVFCVRPPSWTLRRVGRLVVQGMGLLCVCLACGLFLLRYLDPSFFLPYYERLGVVLGYALLTSVELLVVLGIRRYGFHRVALASLARRWRPGGIAFAGLLLAAAVVGVTRLGLTPDRAYWGEPGVPILGWQLCLAILGGAAVFFGFLRAGGSSRLDALMSSGIWLLAVTTWLAVPTDVLKNSFYAPMRPPGDQPFPNSDAGYYDSMAQSLLFGYGYQGEIPSRPLFVVLLSALHLIFGQRYELIIAGQTLILAFIPVVLYKLARALHSPVAGAIVALAAIAREWNSLGVSSQIRVSNSKMLLVDLPSLLMLLVCCYLTVLWLRGKDLRMAIIAGGCFGLALLLRTQALAILPFICALGFASFGTKHRDPYVHTATFLGSMALVLLPWLTRNYLATGSFSIDAPFQYRIIASQYQYSGNLDIENVQLEGGSLLGQLLSFAVQDPLFVLGFVANHALATLVSGILVLPIFHDYHGLRAAIDPYWVRWDGALGPGNVALVIGYLWLISLGLGVAWKRLQWAGVVPLAFSIGYSVANGVARFSGWRYDLPADWVGYFYLGVGIAEILFAVGAAFGAQIERILHSAERSQSPPTGRLRHVAVPILILAVGISPWLAEYLAAPRVLDTSERALEWQISSSAAVASLGVTDAQIAGFAGRPGSVLAEGRVLYPRFFSRDNGLASAHPWPAYAPRDYPRLGFLLLNDSRRDVILPTRRVPNGPTQAGDVVLLGCDAGDHVEARLVLEVDLDRAFVGESLSNGCS